MNQSELIRALHAARPNLARSDVAAMVDAFFRTIDQRLVAGGRVELRGFGSFSTRARDARIGRDPRSGKAVAVTAKRAVHYQQSKAMTTRLNPERRR